MKIAFVHIPKTGGGSVFNWFKNNNLMDLLVYYGHKDLDYIKSHYTGTYSTSFSIVRNTYDKLISSYVFSKNKMLKKANKGDNRETHLKLLAAHEQGLIPFVQTMIDLNYIHTRSQIEYTKGVEHILKTPNENNILQKLTGCSIPIQKTDRILSYNKKDFYTPQYIRFVEKHFGQEIEHFGFQPNY